MLKDEISTNFTIEAISFMRHNLSTTSEANNFSIYFALSDSYQLTDVFEDNYILGTRQQVLLTEVFAIDGEPGDWITFELDTPFYYSNNYNLVIETFNPEGDCYTSVYGSATTYYRSLLGYGESSSSGDLFKQIPHMMLEGSQSLENSTVGAIKIILGR